MKPASALASLLRAMRSRRTAAVVLQSFASGLPLGLVWYAIPDWMRDIGVDLRIVGLITLAQAPWSFKVLWSPAMDRFAPPAWGRRRGWMAAAQLALLLLGLALAGLGERPEAIWVVGALALATALASASQDIAIDAYAVEVLDHAEQGAAAGARTAAYRAAMLVSGSVSLSLAARVGWPAVNALLACAYIPMLVVTWRSPEPDTPTVPPRSLYDATWLPFTSFLARPRALEILAFVVLYKLADQLAQSLTRPFLIDMGYGPDARGVALGTIGIVATVVGAVAGGWVTTLVGLGHSLWAFGFLQLASNGGYVLLAVLGRPDVGAMYAATSFELLTSGLATGAFSVLLLRLTEKRFSATQYALFSSLFALPRVLAGPVAGFAAAAYGWPSFFLATLVVGVPGLLMLSRFVPLGVREPALDRGDVGSSARVTANVTMSALVGGASAAIVGLALLAGLDVLQRSGGAAGGTVGLRGAFGRLLHPADAGEWLAVAGLVTFSAVSGLFAAALRVRRPQAGRR
jgi:PAT family beta-lactamase induction signal transducer AmpG